jgi:hypothetical protein
MNLILESSLPGAFLEVPFHGCRSADIPVRFGVCENEEADKNVRPPDPQGMGCRRQWALT